MKKNNDKKVVILQAISISIVIVGMVFISRTLKGIQPHVK